MAWAKKFVEVTETIRYTTERAFDIYEGLSLDLVELTCRRRDLRMDSTNQESLPVHADNCYYERGMDDEQVCTRDSSISWWRSHSAVLWLNSAAIGDFVGGDFFFAPDFNAPPFARVHVAPRSGRMVAFTAGEENIHGVEAVTNGTRCQVSVFFTDDQELAAATRELHDAIDIFEKRRVSEVEGEDDEDFEEHTNISFVNLCKRPRPAREMGKFLGELVLPSENRSLQLRSLGHDTGPQVTYIKDFLSEQEMWHVIEKASANFQSSVVDEGDGLKAASYRTSESSWLSDDSEDPLITGILARIKLVTGLSLVSAEPFQVAHYMDKSKGKYEPHLDWGVSTKVSRDYDEIDGIYRGARMATFLIYLNDVASGGATAFVKLNLSIVPERGSAVLWYNLHPSAEGDTLVRHGACPVEGGEKFIMTKWIHEAGNEASFDAAWNSPRFVRDWSGLTERLRLGGESDLIGAEPLLERQACGARVVAGHCIAKPVQMARACPGHCEETATESSLRQRIVLDDLVDEATATDLLHLALRACVIGEGYGGEERPLSHLERFCGVQPRESALWALQQPEGALRTAAVASVHGLLQAARKMRAAVSDRFSLIEGQRRELHFDYIHLFCREAASLLVNDSRRMLEGWSMFDSRLTAGGDLLVETMTWWEAEKRCLETPRCLGFTFEGPLVQEPVLVYLKDNSRIYERSTNWTSFVRKQGSSSNVEDSHSPHADNCHRTERGGCKRELPSYHWRSHGAILYLHGPESGDFVGGDFFYQPLWDSSHSQRSRISPKAGRMVAYGAGLENIHGVERVHHGTRCALGVWLSRSVAHAATTLEEAENLLVST
eukprot:TRINITY_DN31636_c0_g2_i1.p1 TRINITY_DN31636_c0_g2~~TRINITY_DN31636_c0_g2_i1.p1  ORF type:complete len:881 (-),score=142.06 TRINITY_DN31636_c0_g2_i1:363-2864(-)